MDLDVDRLDRDGALREAAAGVPRETRKDFLLGLAGGGAALAALTLAEPARAQSKTDVEILNYALTLEYLQAAFYTEASGVGLCERSSRSRRRAFSAPSSALTCARCRRRSARRP